MWNTRGWARTRRWVVTEIGVVAVALGGCTSGPARPEASTVADFEHRDRALEEVAELHGHPWAGMYNTGLDLVGQYVLLAPEEGAVWASYSCLSNLVCFLGPIENVSDAAVVIGATKPESYAVSRFGPRLVRFTWGERRHVAWPGEFERAEARLDEGDHPARQPDFFMVHQDDRDKATGTPEEFVRIIRGAFVAGIASADR